MNTDWCMFYLFFLVIYVAEEFMQEYLLYKLSLINGKKITTV